MIIIVRAGRVAVGPCLCTLCLVELFLQARADSFFEVIPLQVSGGELLAFDARCALDWLVTRSLSPQH